MLMDVPGAYKDKGVARVESLEELQNALVITNDRISL